jgi:tRNA uridine 5-carboxymethylaminomethyl modification enzyme
VTILIKYKGYIEKALKQAEKQMKMEQKSIPNDINYAKIKNLALEARQKLSEIQPLTIGQASRISGINPADISVLLIYLKQKYNEDS